MYNLRYHIVSLVAVFLALAVGLVLGTVVVDRGLLDSQRTTLVKSLQTDFTGLKKENDDLRRDRDRLHAFAVDALPSLISGMLQGRTILIVTNAGRNDGLSTTRDALRVAGASSIVLTFASKDVANADPAVQGLLGADATPAAMASTRLAEVLAAEWSKPGASQPMTQMLVSKGLLTIEGGTGRVQGDAVVLLASFDGQADPALVSLASLLDKAGVTAVGVETQAITSGVADAALGAGLSTVDDIDRPEGEAALVYVLAGKAQGHFGVKAEATALYPRLR